MAVLTHLETDTGTNVDISGATAVGAYTANGDKLIMVDVSIDAVAGNGDYVMYVTRQIGGSGSAYRILPQTTMAAASGLTAISGQSGWITVRNGDVLTVYVDGLAGDTSTPDWSTRWFELAGVTAAAVADAVLDEATSGHTSAGSFSKAVTDILADTGTDGVVVASGQTVATVTNLTNLPTMPSDWVTASGLKADAVTEIQSGLATSSALATVDGIVDDILVDTSTTLDGKLNTIDTNVDSILADTGTDGVVVASGQTVATVTNLTNLPTMPADWVTAAGVKTDAVTKIQNGLATPTNITAGTITTTTNLTNLPAITTNWLTAAGIAADAVTELQAGLALEATLTAIKGAGWTTETLVTLKAYVDEIETRLTATRAGYLDKLNVTGTLAHSDAAAAYKADVSGLAPANEYDAQLSAIQADLNNPAQYRADVSGLATQESVNAIPTTPLLAANYTAPDNAGIGAIKTKTDQLTFTTLNKVDASATIDPTGLATSADLAVVDENVDAIKEKTDQMAFTVPNKIDASATVDPTGIATSEELEIIGEKVDNVLDKLNVSSVEFVTSVVGSTITILRGDTLTASLLNLGSMESCVSLDFTVKASMHQSDDDAVIRIRKNASGLTDGLLRLNGAAHTIGTDGSITINDASTGDITIMLKATVTDDLVPGTYVYDIQLIEANGVSTLTTGTLIVSADVTRLVA